MIASERRAQYKIIGHNWSQLIVASVSEWSIPICFVESSNWHLTVSCNESQFNIIIASDFLFWNLISVFCLVCVGFVHLCVRAGWQWIKFCISGVL